MIKPGTPFNELPILTTDSCHHFVFVGVSFREILFSLMETKNVSVDKFAQKVSRIECVFLSQCKIQERQFSKFQSDQSYQVFESLTSNSFMHVRVVCCLHIFSLFNIRI